MRALPTLLLAATLLLSAGMAGSRLAAAEEKVPTDPVNLGLDGLPVLHQGRIKPFRVAAEEALLATAGVSRLPGYNDGPAATVATLLADPTAADQPLVWVPWLAQHAELGITPEAQRASLHQVAMLEGKLGDAFRRHQDLDQRGLQGPWSADDQALLTLGNRYFETRTTWAGQTFMLAPLAVDDAERAWVAALEPRLAGNARPWAAQAAEALAGKPDAAARNAALKKADIWLTWEDLIRAPDPLLADAPSALAAVLRAPRDAAVLHARQAARDADLGTHAAASPGLIATEVAYTRTRPFTIAWVCFILGGLAVAVGLNGRRGWYRAGLALSAVALLATTAGLAVRTVISGLGAVTNLYETLIYVSLIVGVLGLVFARMSGRGIYAVAGGVGAGLLAMIGEAMPPDLGQHIGQLQPVLRSKFWLWIHVKVVVGAYAPLALALVLGNIVLWQAWWRRRAVTMEESRLLYRCLQWGTVLMAAGTLLGAVWADQAWGRFWGWDPKEVGALVIILTYLIPLHLRYVGAVGPTGLAGWSVLGFLSVLWSWYGVNFILGAGKHAYAFGDGGQWLVLPLAGVQIVVTVIQLVGIKRAVARRKLTPEALTPDAPAPPAAGSAPA